MESTQREHAQDTDNWIHDAEGKLERFLEAAGRTLGSDWETWVNMGHGRQIQPGDRGRFETSHGDVGRSAEGVTCARLCKDVVVHLYLPSERTLHGLDSVNNDQYVGASW